MKLELWFIEFIVKKIWFIVHLQFLGWTSTHAGIDHDERTYRFCGFGDGWSHVEPLGTQSARTVTQWPINKPFLDLSMLTHNYLTGAC
jgi:hypothetical protein